MQRSLCILLVLCALARPAKAGPCSAVYGLLKEGAKTGARVTGKTIANGLKAAYYGPVVLPFKVAKIIHAHRKEGLKRTGVELAHALWKDRFHLLGWGVLAFLQQTTGITHNQFEDETEEFEVYGGEGVRVIVDAFPKDDPLYANSATEVYNTRYKDKDTGQKVILIQAPNFESMRDQIIEIIRTHGKISHVDYFGHGWPGRLSMPEEEFYGKAYEDVGQDTSPTGKPPVHRYQTYFEDDTVQISTIQKGFLPNAKFRFTSCFTMNGEGKEKMCQLGQYFMGRNGGTVYGSKVQILPNPVEFAALKSGLGEPPEWLKAYGDLLAAPQGVATWLSSREHGRRYWGKQDVEAAGHTLHLNRTDQVTVEPISEEVRPYYDNSRMLEFAKEWREEETKLKNLIGGLNLSVDTKALFNLRRSTEIPTSFSEVRYLTHPSFVLLRPSDDTKREELMKYIAEHLPEVEVRPLDRKNLFAKDAPLLKYIQVIPTPSEKQAEDIREARNTLNRLTNLSLTEKARLRELQEQGKISEATVTRHKNVIRDIGEVDWRLRHEIPYWENVLPKD